MKKTILTLLTLSILINTAYSEDVCRYMPGQTIFRCDNSLPNVIITPGEDTNITIYCCITGDEYNNTDSYKTYLNIVFNESFSKQYMENDSRITETNLVFYNASQWISAYYFPEEIQGFQTFPVTLTFTAPTSSKYYKEGMIQKARFDLSVNIPGRMIPQLAILPNVRLPIDYKSFDYKLMVYVSGVTLVLILLSIITFKNNKFNQKVKKFFKSFAKKKEHKEAKEEKKEEKKEEVKREE